MKTKLFLVLVLLVPAFCLMAQENKASMLLSSAVYEEEVSGNLTKAADLYLDLIKKYPDARPEAAKALYHLGLITEKMGKQKAGDYFTRLVSNYPDQKELVVLAKERLAKSESVTSAATVKAELVFRQATELYNQLKYDAAAAEYGKVIALVPKSALAQEAQLWVGQCQYRQGKYDLAVISFKTTIKDYPQSTVNPVTEMLISQAEEAKSTKSGKKNQSSPIVTVSDKTILDPETGIRYTKVNTWAGENDIIKDASLISDIAPNRKFLLYDDKVIPFDNSAAINPYGSDTTYMNRRLSQDGTRIAYFTMKGISVVPVNPETGKPQSSGKSLVNIKPNYTQTLNWSPDGKEIVFSSINSNTSYSLMTCNVANGLTKVITNPGSGYWYDPVYSKDGSKIFYRRNTAISPIQLRSLSVGKSLSLLDSCLNGYKFLVSPDDQWIIHRKSIDQKVLFRLADRQSHVFSTPELVGDYVSWSREGNKVYFYKSTFDNMNILKVVSVFGGAPYELPTEYGQYPLGWTPDGNCILTESREGTYFQISGLNIVNMANRVSRTVEGLAGYNGFELSPDHTKILLYNRTQGKPVDVVVRSFSVNDCKAYGEPKTIITRLLNGLWYDAWSPDGKKVGYCQQGDIWLADGDGGSPIQLTKTPVTERFPSWSPDGKWIAAYVYSSDTLQVQIFGSTDGEMKRAIKNTDFFDWAPDSKEIVVAFLDGRLSSVSLATGESRKIANWKEISKFDGLNYLECSPDGKWVAINGYCENSGENVHMYLINVAEGRAAEIDGTDSRDKDAILWSPDSKWILFNTYGPKKTGFAGTLWEADLTDFMNRMKPATETGFTTDFDFKTPVVPAGGVPADGNFTDTRDGHLYKYKKIGSQTWMTENLAYLPAVGPDSASSPLEKNYFVLGYQGLDVKEAKGTVNYGKYGVLYNWVSATDGATGGKSDESDIKGACPTGWHLPGDAEWMELEKFLGMNEGDLGKTSGRSSGWVDKKLKSTSWGDDDVFAGLSGFNAMPGGFIGSNAKFYAVGGITHMWTSSMENNKIILRSISNGYAGISRSLLTPGKFAASVRCVKDN